MGSLRCLGLNAHVQQTEQCDSGSLRYDYAANRIMSPLHKEVATDPLCAGVFPQKKEVAVVVLTFISNLPEYIQQKHTHISHN